MNALAMLVVSSLAASPWETSWSSSAVATYFDRDQQAAVVVSVGSSTTDSERALITALRASGRLRLVMGGESVQVKADDRDEAIVKKTAHLPIDLVLVHRVFPGQGEIAVVTIYDRSGNALGAMSATAGQPLAVREARTGTSGREAVQASLRETVPPPAPSTGSAPVAADRRITAAAGATIDLSNGQVVATWVELYQGGKRLSGNRFYSAIGRADLVAKYDSRRTTKIGLMAGGGAGLLVGGLLAYAGFVFTPGCSGFEACPARTGFMAAGGVTGTAGLVLLMVGAFLNPHPVGPAEALRLADTFNRSLTISVAPQPGGGSVSIAGRF
ncbi:MAG: hypothetical protein QM817_17175 [Archangium sp.]